MNSLAFIREAKALIEEIRMANVVATTADESAAKGRELQKRINTLFSGLQNPTLASAFNLRDMALSKGFVVAPQMLHRLAQFDTA